MTRTKFRIRLDGTTRAARGLTVAAEQFDDIVQRHMDRLQEFAVDRVYRRLAAPLKDSGTLQRGIQARQTGRLSFNIHVRAIDPESGFNYAPVTRFGHDVEIIRPLGATEASRRGRIMTVGVLHWFTKGSVGPKGHIFEGDEVFAAFSRGFHPTHDWAEPGADVVQTAARRIGKAIAEDVARKATS